MGAHVPDQGDGAPEHRVSAHLGTLAEGDIDVDGVRDADVAIIGR